MPRPEVHRFDLVLVGFGHVGRRFARLLDERRDELRRQLGLAWRVVGIATRRHGCAWNPRGLDVGRALEVAERRGSLESLSRRRSSRSRPDTPADLIGRIHTLETSRGTGARRGHAVMVETTVLDIARGQPAIDHVTRALSAGAHVVTANKGPAAFAYRQLKRRADAAGRAFLFEGAVMDGIPIFNLVRDTLPAVRILGFRGVVNSTTNFILSEVEAGGNREQARRAMQAAGIAEADASFDMDGWDAATKTAALANVLMGGRITPHQVERTGIAAVEDAEVRAAVARGRRVRLVASAEREGRHIRARVAPVELDAADLLANLRGMANALVLRTDLLGEVAVTQLDSGLTQTAYALLSDLVTIRRRFLPAGRGGQR